MRGKSATSCTGRRVREAVREGGIREGPGEKRGKERARARVYRCMDLDLGCHDLAMFTPMQYGFIIAYSLQMRESVW